MGRSAEAAAGDAATGGTVEDYPWMGTCEGTCEGTPMVIWALIWQQTLVLQERVLCFVGICDDEGCDRAVSAAASLLQLGE